MTTIEWRWLRGNLDDEADNSTFASVRVNLGDEVATRVYDHAAGGERDTLNVPLYPLAHSVARDWWTLLFEPRKSSEINSLSEARHSLDAFLNGYVFPPITLWSGGNDTIIAETPDIRQPFSKLEFLPPRTPSITLSRNELEQNLFELVEAAVARLPAGSAAAISTYWTRVRESLGDNEERNYCIAAGQLGIDPYDPNAPDFSLLAERVSQPLFSNVCEAVTQDELAEAVNWAHEGERRLTSFPNIDISGFGAMPARSPGGKIWEHGYESARSARRNLGLEHQSPRRIVDQIFGPLVRANATSIEGTHPSALEGVTSRVNGSMRVITPYLKARSRRFTLCRASYLAWRSGDGDASAVTTATTLNQQASRAFAAEMLAPAEMLKERAGSKGLTSNDVVQIAHEYVCPERVIVWQAYNHQIPLRDVVIPRHYLA